MRALSLCTCCRHYPGAAAGRRRRSSHPAVPAFPDNVVGSACTSSFSRFAQRSLALRPAHSRRHLYVTCYTEGFSHFVTSMTAPVASGWSGCRVGLTPTGKRRLGTAHTCSGHSGFRSWTSHVSAACRQPASADPKRSEGNADLAVRHSGAFHRHSILSETSGAHEHGPSPRNYGRSLTPTSRRAWAVRGLSDGTFTNSKPRQRRASSCRQKPSRSLRCVAAALHFGADVSDIGNALETLDIFDRGRLLVHHLGGISKRSVGSAASISLVKSVPKPIWSMPTRRFKWSNSST